MPKRQRQGLTTIELTDDARVAIQAVIDRTGLPKKVAISRVLEWFADQSEILQALILGQIPETIQGPAAEIALAAIRDRDGPQETEGLGEATEKALRRANRHDQERGA